MRAPSLLLAAAASLSGQLSTWPFAAASEVTPVGKVLEMLAGMLEKAEEDRHREEVQFAAYSQFCSDTALQKNQAIATTTESLDVAKAAVQEADTEAARLATKIQAHEDRMRLLEADQAAAKAARSEEMEAYLAMKQNYTESLEAISSALSVLKSQNYERAGEGPSVLLQKGLNAKTMQVLRSATTEEPDLDFAPELPVTAYAPKSGKVIELLEKLLDSFRAKSEELDKEEAARGHAYSSLMQDLADNIKAEQTGEASSQKARAKELQASAKAVAEVQDLSKLLADDEEYLENLNTTCNKKSSQFEKRQALRKEEIGALTQAKEIIASAEVSGTAEKHLPAAAALVALPHRSLAQLRASTSGSHASLRHPGLSLTSFKAARSQMKVAEFLRSTSERLHSEELLALASSAEADPFAKVKQLIEELIQRLLQEANNEAEHKGWCDKELATNEHTRKTKTQEVESLRATGEVLQASIAKLDKELEELEVSLNTTALEVEEVTALREKERATNAATLAEAQAAQEALVEAVKILKDFYAKAAKAPAAAAAAAAAALLEERVAGSQEPPPLFEEGLYEGQQVQGGGVLAMLDVIHSDFVRLEKDTKAAEDSAQSAYDHFMEESSMAQAEMETTVKHKEKAKSDAGQSLEETNASLSSAETTLESAWAEFEKLKPACIETGQTYSERRQRRKDEIAALKEALEILENV